MTKLEWTRNIPDNTPTEDEPTKDNPTIDNPTICRDCGITITKKRYALANKREKTRSAYRCKSCFDKVRPKLEILGMTWIEEETQKKELE